MRTARRASWRRKQVRITPRLGDALLFNPANFHSVEPNPGGRRIAFAFFLGLTTTGQLIGRYLAYYVSIIPLCLGLIWVGIDAKKHGFHDKLASTLVIRSR